MVLSIRDLIALLHGMGFGVLFMLAFSGVIAMVYAATSAGEAWSFSSVQNQLFRFYLASMAGLSWLAVLSGTYIIYPWYRAAPPAGTTDLSHFPQRLLQSNPLTAGWHSVGMEWKEHISWFTPIAMTMVAFLFMKYGPQIARQRHMRNAAVGFIVAAFFATFVSGFFGTMLGKRAPVSGGPDIVIMGHQ